MLATDGRAHHAQRVHDGQKSVHQQLPLSEKVGATRRKPMIYEDISDAVLTDPVMIFFEGSHTPVKLQSCSMHVSRYHPQKQLCCQTKDSSVRHQRYPHLPQSMHE